MSINIFGFQSKNQLSNASVDGDRFITKRIDEELLTRMAKMSEENDKIISDRTSSKGYSIVKNILFFLIIFCLIMLLYNVKSVQDFVHNIFYVVLLVLGIIGNLVLVFYNRKKKNAFLHSKEYQDIMEEFDRLYQEANDALGVPATAYTVDVFLWPYSTDKNGQKKPIKMINYLNYMFTTFVEDDKLVIANIKERFEIPLSSITSIEDINQKISFYGWNKDIMFNDPSLSEYKIRLVNNAIFLVNQYSQINFVEEGVEYHFVIPPYEAKVFKDLINK